MLIDTNFIQKFSNDMIFVKANAEKADTATAKQYNVSGYPTFVITDSKGVEIDRIIGYMPAEDFLATVDDYMHGIGTLPSLLAEAENSTDRTLYYKIGEKYKYSGRPSEATEWYTKIISSGEPTDSLSGEAYFALADMKRRSKDYDDAIAAYRDLKNSFKGTMFEEAGGFYVAYINMIKGDTATAIAEFKNFINEFPDAEDFDYATRKIKELSGDSTESN